MVFYDQRGHGQSGAAPVDTYTVPQLGQDLETILQVMVPRGPVVLVGHSMGGMTVLSHARQFPRHYGHRIVGAALISSSAEGLPRSPLGEILQNPALEAVRFAAGATHPGWRTAPAAPPARCCGRSCGPPRSARRTSAGALSRSRRGR